jgi:hypothetical protein
MNNGFPHIAKAFSAVIDWYMYHDDAHVHAALAMTCDDTEDGGPVKHFVYVEHCDHQRQLLATLYPVAGKTIVGSRPKVTWHIQLEDLDNPVWLVSAFKARGCGPHRCTKEEAVGAFVAHAKKFHTGQLPTFHPGAPGRTVVHLSVDGGGFRPYGVILDERVIRGERVIVGEPEGLFGYDIYG